MKSAKPKAKASATKSTPRADRPNIPQVYGMTKGKKGLLDWSHVQERMKNAKVYWVSTVTPQGKPQTRPVDGLWLDNKFYFGGDPKTKRSRNLYSNPAVSIHLEEGYNVVILEGDALPLKNPGRELATRLADASNSKYGYGMTADSYMGEGTFVLQPRVVFAWTQALTDATRWKFEE
jgi:hypothetical protein